MVYHVVLLKSDDDLLVFFIHKLPFHFCWFQTLFIMSDMPATFAMMMMMSESIEVSWTYCCH